jgi:hypothetical protein
VERAFVAVSVRSVGESSGARLPIGGKEWTRSQLTAETVRISISANFARVGREMVYLWANNGTLFADGVSGKGARIGLSARS